VPAKSGGWVVLTVNGCHTRGHYPMFPRYARRQANRLVQADASQPEPPHRGTGVRDVRSSATLRKRSRRRSTTASVYSPDQPTRPRAVDRSRQHRARVRATQALQVPVRRAPATAAEERERRHRGHLPEVGVSGPRSCGAARGRSGFQPASTYASGQR